jgi:hypothetical protein
VVQINYKGSDLTQSLKQLIVLKGSFARDHVPLNTTGTILLGFTTTEWELKILLELFLNHKRQRRGTIIGNDYVEV